MLIEAVVQTGLGEEKLGSNSVKAGLQRCTHGTAPQWDPRPAIWPALLSRQITSIFSREGEFEHRQTKTWHF